MFLLIWVAGVAASWFFVFWFVGFVILKGRDQSEYDRPEHPPTGTASEPSPEHVAAEQNVRDTNPRSLDLPAAERLRLARERLDEMGAKLELDAEIRPVEVDGMAAEWMLAPGADPAKRVLYLHGGAFTIGSPLSHRGLTYEFSHRTGSSVLAVDYRLVPEHPRGACIEDSRRAYRWILENGPDGPSQLDRLIVAGDSAGGNLTLVTIAWARDQGLRQADLAVALSPVTDSTFSSPSLKRNLPTDTMLGPLMAKFVRAPQLLLLWGAWLSTRIIPSNPIVSPLHGNLSNLPPMLVQASLSEMLLDDAIRYVNKANACGTRAILQTWPNMLHVWQAFRETPEATEAWDHVERFIHEHSEQDVALTTR